MRRLLISIGTLSLLTYSNVTYACPITTQVEDLINLDPVSRHFVQATLDRVDDGLANPNSSGTPNSFAHIIVERFWGLYAKNTVNATLSLQTNTVPTNRSLEEQTSCLRLDTQILEGKLEQLRCELNTAYESGDGQRMFSVRSMMFFVQERIAELHRGALNPFYSASDWGRLQWFDDRSQVVCLQPGDASCPGCCQMSTQTDCADAGGSMYYRDYGLQACLADGGVLPPGQPDPGLGLCPFTTNYLPPTTTGYGCDTEALGSALSAAASLEPFRSEYNALEELINDRNEFIQLAEPIGRQRQQLDAFTGADPLDLTNFGLALTRTHKEVAGCIDPTSILPDGTEALQLNPLYTSGATITEPRGPFSFTLNEPKISRLLIVKILNRETLRALPEYVQTSYEAGTQGGDVFDSLYDFVSGVVSLGFKQELRPQIQKQSAEQAIQKAELLGMSQDMLMQIQESYGPLRDSIGGLSRSADTTDEGMRLFGINFAWYLRRSCTDRPCNETLDRVLKILFEDECFPYTSGEYENSDSFERCRSAAGL